MSGDTIQVLPYICEGRGGGGRSCTDILCHQRLYTTGTLTLPYRGMFISTYSLQCSLSSMFLRESGQLKTNRAVLCKMRGERRMMRAGRCTEYSPATAGHRSQFLPPYEVTVPPRGLGSPTRDSGPVLSTPIFTFFISINIFTIQIKI